MAISLLDLNRPQEVARDNNYSGQVGPRSDQVDPNLTQTDKWPVAATTSKWHTVLESASKYRDRDDVCTTSTYMYNTVHITSP